MRRRTPATMDRLLTAVFTALAVSWHLWQVAAAVRHQSMRRVMVPAGQAVAPIPAVIPVDQQDVHRVLAQALNLLVH